MTAELWIGCPLSINKLHFECPRFQDMGVVQLEGSLVAWAGSF